MRILLNCCLRGNNNAADVAAGRAEKTLRSWAPRRGRFGMIPPDGVNEAQSLLRGRILAGERLGISAVCALIDHERVLSRGGVSVDWPASAARRRALAQLLINDHAVWWPR